MALLSGRTLGAGLVVTGLGGDVGETGHTAQAQAVWPTSKVKVRPSSRVAATSSAVPRSSTTTFFQLLLLCAVTSCSSVPVLSR